MDIVQSATPENISLVANVLLIAAIARMKKVHVFVKAAIKIKNFITVVSKVNSLITNAEKAFADGTLTPDETSALITEIKGLVNSKELKEFTEGLNV